MTKKSIERQHKRRQRVIFLSKAQRLEKIELWFRNVLKDEAKKRRNDNA